MTRRCVRGLLALLLALGPALPSSRAGLFGALFGDESEAAPAPSPPAPTTPAFPPLSELVPVEPGDFPDEARQDAALLSYFEETFFFLGEGDASNYGRKDGFDGKLTANGEVFDRGAVSAAIVGFWQGEGEAHCFTRLPRSDRQGVGYPILVVYPDPEAPEAPPRWMFVRITDRGPYANKPARKRWRKKVDGKYTREFKDAIAPYVRFKGIREDYWHKDNWAWDWRNCDGSDAWETRMPYPGRILDLSEAAFVALGGEESLRHGLLRGVRAYLPPVELFPEDLPELMREVLPEAP